MTNPPEPIDVGGPGLVEFVDDASQFTDTEFVPVASAAPGGTPLGWRFAGEAVPRIRTALPGPRAAELLARDDKYVSPSYTRVYPLVVARGSGAVIEDVDGNLFLDFTAGIAV